MAFPIGLAAMSGGASILGGLGSIFGADERGKALEEAMELIESMYGSADADLEKLKKVTGRLYRTSAKSYNPYRKAGVEMLPMLKDYASPGGALYDWRMKEGEKGINRYLASRGLYGSGEAGSEMYNRLNSQLTGEETDKAYSRLSDIVNLGYGATGAKANIRMGKAGAIGGITTNQANLQTQLAQLLSSFMTQQGENKGSMYQSLFNMPAQGLGLYSAMGGFGGGGGGGNAASMYRPSPSANYNPFNPMNSWSYRG